MSAPAPARKLPWLDGAFLLAGLALLVYVVSRFPLADVLAACRHAGPLVVLAMVVALGWVVLNTFGMSVLLHGRVPFWTLLYNRLVGDGYNSLIPLAGLGGEPWKLRHLSTYVPTELAVAALIRDRVIENAVGFLITAIVIAVGLTYYPMPLALRTALIGYSVVATFCAVLSVALVATRLPGRAGARLARWLGGAAETDATPLPLGQLLHVAAWNFAGRIVGSLEVGILLWLLGGRPGPGECAFVDCVLNAAGFIGFVIPQGLGVAEGASVFILRALGYAGAVGVAFALVRRGRLLAVALLGVLLHLGVRALRRPRPDAPR